MKHIDILPATAVDALYVAEHLRQADINELKAACGEDADEVLSVLRGYVNSTEVWVGYVDKVPVAVFGYTKHGDVGIPWMLATDGFKKSAKSSIRYWHSLLEHINQVCPTLINYVHAENHDALRWLGYMGFHILPSIPLGTSRFHPFVRTIHV